MDDYNNAMEMGKMAESGIFDHGNDNGAGEIVGFCHNCNSNIVRDVPGWFACYCIALAENKIFPVQWSIN